MVTCDQIRGGIKAFLMDAVAITVAGPPQYSITTTPELSLVSGGSKRACLVVRTNTMALVLDYTAIIVTSQKFVFASAHTHALTCNSYAFSTLKVGAKLHVESAKPANTRPAANSRCSSSAARITSQRSCAPASRPVRA